MTFVSLFVVEAEYFRKRKKNENLEKKLIKCFS